MKTLVFRRYVMERGMHRPDDSVPPVERESYADDDTDSIVQEMQDAGYELECILRA